MIPEAWKEYLDGWRSLTDAESRAITVQDWDGLEAAQKVKRELQREFEEVLDDAVKRSKGGPASESRSAPGEAIPQAVRDVVQGLLAAERANAAALATAMERIRSRMDRADHARRSLKQVHRAYSACQGENSHHWQFYS